MTTTTNRSRDWRCRFLRKHRWVPRTTGDGGRNRPARCGTDREEYPGGPMTGFAAG